MELRGAFERLYLVDSGVFVGSVDFFFFFVGRDGYMDVLLFRDDAFVVAVIHITINILQCGVQVKRNNVKINAYWR
jgi:hypothetical protein